MSNDQKNEFKQAARDVQYYGSMFKRMAFLQDLLGQAGDLEQVIREKKDALSKLTLEEDHYKSNIDVAKAEAVKIVEDSKAEAALIVAEAAKVKASVDDVYKAAIERKRVLEAEAKLVEQKIAERRSLWAEEDQKLRRVREQLSELKKHL